MTTIREQFEERERRFLSPLAALACESRGRQDQEPPHDYRTAFQRDRDRIIHTKAFRRLKRKTQVFLAPEDDYYRTRLTHTLEVAQISRTVARALFLNEDLTEAIALGHDLGHTPFGHAGEAVLDEMYHAGFHHAEQSVRLVDKLESRPQGLGLNLTVEVRDGIRSHSKVKAILLGKPQPRSTTLEGDLVGVCDAIAYISHDIDDAIRGRVITPADLPQDAIQTVGQTPSERINTMVSAVIQGSKDGPIAMTNEIREAMVALRSYLFSSLYPCPVIMHEIEKAKRILRDLYGYLLDHPPDNGNDSNDSLERRTVDFVAGMTDPYALQLYRRHFFPEAWGP